MIRILFGIFVILHGLVHLLYSGQSTRRFELQPGMVWPDGSWVFSRFLGTDAVRNLGGVLLILAAIGLVASGIGILLGQGWWRNVTIGSAVFSAVTFILLWDGVAKALPEKGGVAILINLAILVAILVFKWTPVR